MNPQAIDIQNSFQSALDTIFSYLPQIIAFLVILIIGYIIAKIVKVVINKLTGRLKIDQKVQRSKAGEMVAKVSPDGKPSHLVGTVVFWIIFLYALVAAIGALEIPALTDFMSKVLAYLPNVIAALLIFVVAAAISGAIVAAVQRTMGDTPTGKLIQTVVPGLVMAIAVFMILTQLHIASTIVIITYAALIGMLALAGALAFGLGGREVAGQMWANAYQKSQEQAVRVKADTQIGRERAREQSAQTRQKWQSRQGSQEGQPGSDPGSHRA